MTKKIREIALEEYKRMTLSELLDIRLKGASYTPGAIDRVILDKVKDLEEIEFMYNSLRD